MRPLRCLLFILTLLALVGCGTPISASPPATATPTAPPEPTLTPSPTPVPQPTSWLANSTLLTIYGRGFGVLPILGRLGMDNTLADVSIQAQPFVTGIHSANGGKPVRIALHLIYGMATPCGPHDNCLAYIDDSGVDIVNKYILPAAKRGWMVILDDQLGGSTPAKEMARIVAKGYLKYDNVGVALDPEFEKWPDAEVPGIPVGATTAGALNAAEREMNAYAAAHPTPHRRILLLHQFQFDMIAQRGSLQLHLPWVDPVFIMDGFGDPGVKAHVYHDLFGKAAAPRIVWRGVKLFYPNQYETAGHGDGPLMTWAQVMGKAPALDIDGKNYWVSPSPNVVVIA